MALVREPAGTVLYWFPGTCARVALVALEEIGEPFELELVNRLDPDYPHAAYAALNPTGKVPTLALDGAVITENPAIQTALARRHPQAGLMPAGEELDALSTMCWFAAGVHPHITRLRFPARVCDDPAAFESVRAHAREPLAQAFTILERRLTDREWLYGEWTILDVYMLWLWFRATGSGLDGTPFGRCAEHAARCEERPSVARTLAREDAAWAELTEAGLIPADWPEQQAGSSRSQQRRHAAAEPQK